MSLTADIFVALVAVLHLYFLVLEMFLWTKPAGLRAFGLSKEKATDSKALAANQGLYNGFLAAGLIWGLILGSAGENIKIFFLCCVVIAGVFGALTASRKILYVQAFPALITLILVFLTSATGLADLDMIKKADKAYVSGWLSNKPDRVMLTLTQDAVIVPSGLPAITGQDSIRAFWWPAGSPPAVITEFTAVQEDAGRSGDMGYVRGTFKLKFTYADNTYHNQGTYLSILKQDAEGTWRISQRMWNDHHGN